MKYSVSMIREFGISVFMKAGLEKKEAEISVESLIQADLRGIKTHGMTHLIGYCDRLDKGTAAGCCEMELKETSASSIVVDAKHAVGMSAAVKVMERCIQKAKISGSCFATVRNGCHYGYGAYIPMKAAEQGMIGFCIANTPPLVVPFGGAEPMLGTNPISIVVPAGKYPPLVLDMATSIVAKGKISLALKEGKTIPIGWAVDKDGNPTTDPAAADVGALLPMGGPKGYGLALLVSLLSSALAGGDIDLDIPRFWEQTECPTNIGYFMGCIDISKFVDLEIFQDRADDLFRIIKSSRAAPGFSEVMIPGELELNATNKGLEEGMELSEITLNNFRELSKRYGLKYPF